jgi:hypothetical protein
MFPRIPVEAAQLAQSVLKREVLIKLKLTVSLFQQAYKTDQQSMFVQELRYLSKRDYLRQHGYISSAKSRYVVLIKPRKVGSSQGLWRQT